MHDKFQSYLQCYGSRRPMSMKSLVRKGLLVYKPDIDWCTQHTREKPEENNTCYHKGSISMICDSVMADICLNQILNQCMPQ